MASPQPSGSFRGLTASKAVKNNVVLRIAYVSEREGKLFIAGPRLALALALGVLIWEFYVKLKDVRRAGSGGNVTHSRTAMYGGDLPQTV